MPQKFSLAIAIDAPLTQIYEHLTDITILGQDHPLAITYVETTPETLPTGTIRRHFRVTDLFTLGPLRLTTSYRVTTMMQADGSVLNEAFQAPGIHLTIHYQFTESSQGIHVLEETTINGPPILQQIATKQAYLAHKTLLQGIKQRVEAGAMISH